MENIIERINIVEGPLEIVNAWLSRKRIDGGIDEIAFDWIDKAVKENKYHYLIKENPKLEECVKKNDVLGFIDEARTMGGKLFWVYYRLTNERLKEEQEDYDRWLEIEKMICIVLSEKEFEEYKKPKIIQKFELVKKFYI